MWRVNQIIELFGILLDHLETSRPNTVIQNIQSSSTWFVVFSDIYEFSLGSPSIYIPEAFTFYCVGICRSKLIDYSPTNYHLVSAQNFL